MDWQFPDKQTTNIVVEGTCSDYVIVESEVFQGSVFRPCLFLVYKINLTEDLTSLATPYTQHCGIQDNPLPLEADPITAKPLTYRMGEELGHGPQPPSSTECTRLPLTRNKKVLYFEYNLHKQTPIMVTSAKYLSITNHKEGSGDSHIDTITATANRT